jgi:cytidylate kinase
MKEDTLLKYMTARLEEETPIKKESGPVITLSREYGCYASHIASSLNEKLTEASQLDDKTVKWKVISNEILQEAAKDLETDPSKISHLFGANEKKFLSDLLESFSTKKYVSDTAIKRAITGIVRSYAEEGHVIIVGRAGCVITKDIAKSIHIRLNAPLDWRIRRIQERFSISESAAKKQVAEFDEKRKTFMSFFRGDKPDTELFDATFNRAKMTEDEIVASIMKIAQSRRFI